MGQDTQFAGAVVGPSERSELRHARAAVPRAAVPRAAVPRAAVPRAAVPRAAVPRAAVPRAAVPRAAVPRAAVPRAAVPRAAVPRFARHGLLKTLGSLFSEHLSGHAFFDLRHLGRCSFCDDLAAIVGGTRTQVDNVIGCLHQQGIMFDDDQ